MCFAFGNVKKTQKTGTHYSHYNSEYKNFTHKNEECKGEYFFYGKLSAFDIYFSKNNQMLKIISERGGKIFQIIFSYFFSKKLTPCQVFLILGFEGVIVFCHSTITC